jgi:hypothetical protein
MHESEPAAFGLLAGLCVLLVAAVTLACGGGCAHYTRLDPQPRLMGHQFTTAVAVEALCINHDPFEDMTMPEIQGGKGSGVVIDARHVLTALHVVMCPYMADVHVVLADGKRIRMHVEKEWPDFDVARLVIASAGSFGPIAPPVLRKPTEGAVCAAVSWPTKAEQWGPDVRFYWRTRWIDYRRTNAGWKIYGNCVRPLAAT